VLSTFESIVIVVLMVGGSVAFLGLLRRIWPTEQRVQHNDLIGWQVTVIGTTYAVIIGFMLYAVWSTFELADGNAEAEANSLLNVVRAAQGLPAGEKQKIEDLGRQYVTIMLTQEWPAMSQVRVSPMSYRVLQQLWATVMSSEVHNASEQTSLDHTITELSAMAEHYRLRQLQARSYLPGILWTVLIAGAVATIVSACLFGSRDFKLHLIQVLMLSTTLSLVLVAIADLNRPFQGSVRVSPAGFERARDALDSMKAANH
jgi:uncharacterized protein DUF4239